MKTFKKTFVGITATIFFFIIVSQAVAMKHPANKKAIVLAGFGTSYPSALLNITNIQKAVQKAFPNIKVRIAFTSNIIRKIWHKRQHDTRFLAANRDIPKEILYVKGPLATIAELQDAGYRTIIVQPTHLYCGEEFLDLCSYVRGLNSIKTIKKKYSPFIKLVIGRPALGMFGPTHDYHEDMKVAAKTLAKDVMLAEKNNSALVYMGHGNEFFSTGIYTEFQQIMRKTYPKAHIFIGTVEGYPSLSDTLFAVKHSKIRKIILKPFMIVAGDHANNDMAGDDDDSWKNTFKKEGIRVKCIIRGLGENQKWANIYVKHIKDVAKDNNITL
jgi:sirohydrochlorin cobaltochelatase